MTWKLFIGLRGDLMAKIRLAFLAMAFIAAALLLSGSSSPVDNAAGKVVTVLGDDGFVDIYTEKTTVADILADAGITIEEELQRTTPSLNTEMPDPGYIVIHRAAEVVIKADGKEISLYSWADTVEEVLEQAEISVEDDIVRPPLDAPVAKKQEIVIVRVSRQLIAEEEWLPAETIFKTDTSVPLGEQRVQIRPRDGKRVTTYEVIFNDGVEMSRTLVGEDVTEPVNGVVVRGVQVGEASYYGPGFHGNKTTSGEIFDKNALTAAHLSLPFGTRVKVTNINTGRSVIVRINDRGPHVAGRIIDLSEAAARRIGIYPGVGRVRLEVVN